MTTFTGCERDVEIPWVLANVTRFPVLDVGSHDSSYLSALAGPVDGIDVRPDPGWQGLRKHYQADIRTWEAPEKYPTIMAVSTVEHVGLAFEVYGTMADDPDGDKHAIGGCMDNLTNDGVLLLTVPWGPTHEHRVWYRRYSTEALDALLDGYNWTAEYHSHPDWSVGGVALVKVTHR